MKIKFALAGEIVSSSKEANRIWRESINAKNPQPHIEAQALSVLKILRENGQ